MPTFKPKNTKNLVICKKTTTTLDSKHKETVAKLQSETQERLPLLLAEKNSIAKKLITRPHRLAVEEKLTLQDRLAAIKLEIKQIRAKEQDYYLTNSGYIFDYFETKKKIAESSVTSNRSTSVVDTFFKLTGSDDPGAAAAAAAGSDSYSTDGNSNGSISDDTTSTVQKYLSNVDESFIDVNNFVIQTYVCRSCFKGELIPVEHEGILVCNNCSESIPYLVENEKPSYKEPPKEVCFYAYKRINHFREILAQFQAKETTQIPDEVIENINQQIKKERINLSQMTNKRAKEILKKLGYNKYYEHIPFIKDKLGIKPPIMSADLEDTLCNLFMDIQSPYAKYCPDDRVNFLNYYYTVYKLCELLDQTQFLPFFPMLKDREKRIDQDEIWRNICDELNWEYIPTI
jgi:hypothetical protein